MHNVTGPPCDYVSEGGRLSCANTLAARSTPAEYLGTHPRWEPRLRRVGLGDCCIPSLVGSTRVL